MQSFLCLFTAVKIGMWMKNCWVDTEGWSYTAVSACSRLQHRESTWDVVSLAGLEETAWHRSSAQHVPASSCCAQVLSWWLALPWQRSHDSLLCGLNFDKDIVLMNLINYKAAYFVKIIESAYYHYYIRQWDYIIFIVLVWLSVAVVKM